MSDKWMKYDVIVGLGLSQMSLVTIMFNFSKPSVLFVQSYSTLCDPMVACQAPLSMGFSRQGLPFPSPGDLPYPGMESWSPTLQADSLLSEPPGKPFLSQR